MIGNQCPSIPASREGPYLTPEEIDKLMSAARSRGRYRHRDATMILLAYRHGLRVSVVIVRIRKPDRNPGGAIDLAGDRLEADCHGDIGHRLIIVNRERERVVGRVGADLG
jgi:hypothetical protein